LIHSALHQALGSGATIAPRRKPFALRNSSSAASSTVDRLGSSRVPVTPKDGSELSVGPTGQPGVGHRECVSTTFVDSEKEGKNRERDQEDYSSAGDRSSHGHRPAVAAGSSDDGETTRGRERSREVERTMTLLVVSYVLYYIADGHIAR